MKRLHLIFLSLIAILAFSCETESMIQPLPENKAQGSVQSLSSGDIKDTKLKISGATASSEELVNDKAGIEKSFDEDSATFWHTKWGAIGPFTITYTLQDADKLDYIMYYPRRPNGGNGNFGEVDIYVASAANPEFVKVLTYDHKNSGQPAKIVLPNSISSPTAVKFEIKSGSNGNASCSEMEFYSIPYAENMKLQIASATASSEELVNDKAGIEKSFDEDSATFWHTKWGATGPFTITYNLKNAYRLDYIMYYPRRPNGGNGNFGEVDIYVASAANPEFVKVLTYDHKNSGQPAKIVLPNSISIPTAVKFEIKSGSNGNASCSEMEFYGQGEEFISGKEVPLGGNSYVTAGSGTITDNGFTYWNSPSTVFSTYFKVKKAGDLSLSLKYTPNGDGNVINVTFAGKTHEVTLPKGSSSTNTVFIGNVTNVEPGYLKVDFQGKTLVGSTYGSPSTLIVSGSAAEELTYVGDFSYYWGRRGPSVHMNYTLPSTQTAEWLYNEVTVPVGYDPVGTYYMANGFGQGYFGMQANSVSERRILFSVWSPYETDDPSSIPQEDRVLLVRKGDGVTINDFGNEGSGGQSYFKYMWKTGTTYKFLNRVRPLDDGYSEYTAYFYAPELGYWKLIAQWKRPKTQTYYTGAHSFLENFNNNMGAHTRKAYYANQWVYTTDGKWVELTNGRFTIDSTGNGGWREDYKGGIENNSFFLQNCGFFNDNVAYGTRFTRTSSGTAPDIDWSTLE